MLKKAAIALAAIFGICILIGIIANATGSGTKSSATPQATTIAKVQPVSQVTPTVQVKPTTAPTVAPTQAPTIVTKPTEMPSTRTATPVPTAASTATTAPAPAPAPATPSPFREAEVVRAITPTRTAVPAKPTATTAASSPTATTAPPGPTAPSVPAPPSGGFDPKAYIGQGDKYNCPHFKSQADAQAVLRADPRDPNKLDGTDNDGIACETLPGPYDRVPVQR